MSGEKGFTTLTEGKDDKSFAKRTKMNKNFTKELDRGTLTISIEMVSVSDEAVDMFIKITFEDNTIDAIFEAEYDMEKISDTHRVFSGMPELFVDFIQKTPSVHSTANSVILCYKVPSGQRVYDFTLSLWKVEPDSIGIRRENHILHRLIGGLDYQNAELTWRIAALETRMDYYNSSIKRVAALEMQMSQWNSIPRSPPPSGSCIMERIIVIFIIICITTLIYWIPPYVEKILVVVCLIIIPIINRVYGFMRMYNSIMRKCGFDSIIYYWNGKKWMADL